MAVPGALLAPPAPALGRLERMLGRLAAQQGCWPPAPPAHVARPAGQVARPAGQATEPSTEQALEAGAVAVDRFVDAGADLVLVAGGGPRTPALVLLAALLDRDPVSVTGTTSAPGWAELVVTLRDGLRAARPHLDDPAALLAAARAVGVAELTGAVLQAAVRRTPVLLSGAPDVWAATLLAQRIAPAVNGWLLAGCSPGTSVAAAAVGALQLVPLLDLQLDAPEGAELALGVLVGGVELAATHA